MQLKWNHLLPFYRREQQDRTPKPAFDGCGSAASQLADVIPPLLLPSGSSSLKGTFAKPGRAAGGGEGSLTLAWHEVHSLCQEPDELVAWMPRSWGREIFPSRSVDEALC